MNADRRRLSLIAHRGHPIAAPLSDDSVARLLDALHVASGAIVVDAGCGTGEWLLRLADRTGCAGLGVDVSAGAVTAAREASTRLPERARPRFVQADAAAWRPEEPADAVLCVGSVHAFGRLRDAVHALREWLRPGGRLLLGDGFWTRAPDAAALAGLGSAPGDLDTLAATMTAITEGGVEVTEQHVSSMAEWDAYEEAWASALEEHLARHPDDPDAAAIRALVAEHRRGYVEGYRGVLGFVTCVAASRR